MEIKNFLSGQITPQKQPLPAKSYMSIYDHFMDFKKKLVNCCCFFLAAATICYFAAPEIILFLLKPLKELNPDIKIFSFSLTEPFLLYLQAATIGGLIMSCPFFLIELYRYISPGLYRAEKMALTLIVFSAIILFIAACAILYSFILPGAIDFLYSYQHKRNLVLDIMPGAGEYISFIMRLTLGFSAVFQLPIVLIMMIKGGIVNVSTLKKVRRIVIVGIFIAAAIVTPPDIMSQIILAVILIILYEITIFIGNFIKKTP